MVVMLTVTRTGLSSQVLSKQISLLTSFVTGLDGDKDKTEDPGCIAFLDLPYVASLHASL